MIWAEYHLPPWEINEHFTPELLHLMMEARFERITRTNEQLERIRSDGAPGISQRVTPAQLFAVMGINPKRNRDKEN